VLQDGAEFVRETCGEILSGIGKFEDEDLAVRMERAACGGFCFFHWIVGKKVCDLSDETRARKSFFNVVTLEVDVRVNFVSDAVVALVALETDVVGRGADPDGFTIHREWRLPHAKMIARGDDGDGFGVGPAVILWSAEE